MKREREGEVEKIGLLISISLHRTLTFRLLSFQSALKTLNFIVQIINCKKRSNRLVYLKFGLYLHPPSPDGEIGRHASFRD